MPSRRRAKTPSSGAADDPIKRFASTLRASEEHERAEKERAEREREEAENAARLAAEQAEAVATARRELDRAIERARAARRAHSGVAEADAAWREAKAHLIELETGVPPDWVRDEGPPPDPGPDGDDQS